MIDKITFSRLCAIMTQYNIDHPQRRNGAYLTGAIVYKSSNWDRPYSETERTYYVSNCNKFFIPGLHTHSLFADCGVRLDWHNWEIDYCYICDKGEMAFT